MSKFIGNNQFSGLSVEERFWQKVDKKSDGECWNWLGCKNQKGYGQFKLMYENPIGMTSATKLSYRMAYGDFPKTDEFGNKILILHTCDNPSCVNPKHLFLGTNADNMKDMVRKGHSTKGKAAHWGTHSANAKLTTEQIFEIRKKYSTGNYTYIQLAKIYGVVFQHIGAIITRKKRKYE